MSQPSGPRTSRLRSDSEGLASGMLAGAGPVKMILSALAATGDTRRVERAMVRPVWHCESFIVVDCTVVRLGV